MQKKKIFLTLFIFFIILGLIWSGVLIYQYRSGIKLKLAGKFGTSADVQEIAKPDVSQAPFDLQSFNQAVEPYILPETTENIAMIKITPG